MTAPDQSAAGLGRQHAQPRVPGQMEAILGALVQPRRTFRRLPSDRVYALAFLGPAYFAFARLVYRTGWEYYLFKLLLVSFAALFVVPAFAWLVRQFLKVYGKRLSTAKLMNIGGYALVPRLVFAVVGTLGALAVGERDSGSLRLVVAVATILIVLYSLALYVYGIVVSPSEDEGEVEAP